MNGSHKRSSLKSNLLLNELGSKRSLVMKCCLHFATASDHVIAIDRQCAVLQIPNDAVLERVPQRDRISNSIH